MLLCVAVRVFRSASPLIENFRQFYGKTFEWERERTKENVCGWRSHRFCGRKTTPYFPSFKQPRISLWDTSINRRRQNSHPKGFEHTLGARTRHCTTLPSQPTEKVSSSLSPQRRRRFHAKFKVKFLYILFRFSCIAPTKFLRLGAHNVDEIYLGRESVVALAGTTASTRSVANA